MSTVEHHQLLSQPPAAIELLLTVQMEQFSRGHPPRTILGRRCGQTRSARQRPLDGNSQCMGRNRQRDCSLRATGYLVQLLRLDHPALKRHADLYRAPFGGDSPELVEANTEGPNDTVVQQSG